MKATNSLSIPVFARSILTKLSARHFGHLSLFMRAFSMHGLHPMNDEQQMLKTLSGTPFSTI